MNVVINFSPVQRTDYWLPVTEKGVYTEVLSTDEIKYGGQGVLNNFDIVAEQSDELNNFVRINIPALGGIILRKKKDSKER